MALRMIGDKVMGLMAKQYQTALGNQLATYGEFWCCGLWIEIDADVSVAMLDWRATTEAWEGEEGRGIVVKRELTLQIIVKLRSILCVFILFGLRLFYSRQEDSQIQLNSGNRHQAALNNHA